MGRDGGLVARGEGAGRGDVRRERFALSREGGAKGGERKFATRAKSRCKPCKAAIRIKTTPTLSVNLTYFRCARATHHLDMVWMSGHSQCKAKKSE